MRTSIDYAYGGNVEYITDTAEHVVNAKFAICETDVVISAVTLNSTVTGNSVLTGTHPKGTMLPFSFSKITLTSGQLWAVRGL
jgi:hypothetical protein